MSESNAQWWNGVRALVNRAIDLLQAAAEADPEFARSIAEVFGKAAGEVSPTREEASATGLAEGSQGLASEAVAAAVVESEASAAVELVERHLRLGDAGVLAIRARAEEPAAMVAEPKHGPRVIMAAPSEAMARAEAQEVYNPGTVVRCCRLKAEACRWQSERSRRLDDGEDVREADQGLIGRAAALGCYLWMVQPTRWRERGERAFSVVAGCYEAMADAVELMALVDQRAGAPEGAMALLAEASSALRAAIEDYASTGRDHDQQAVFQWLDRETYLRKVYVARHMRLDDSAPPENHADLRRRIAEARRSLESTDRVRRERENLFGKIQYSVKKLQDAFEPAHPFDADHPQLRSLEHAVEALLGMGVPASNRRLRELLEPVLERLPEHVAPALERALQEVDAYLDQLAETAGEGEPVVVSPQDDLLAQVRAQLAGRHAVLTGGIPNERHRRRLEADLGLASLRWLLVKHGSSFDADAEPALRDPDVSLVMAMTRWRSHRDGPAARRICKERGIPFVELTGGYGSRRVAHEILRQASDLLASSA